MWPKTIGLATLDFRNKIFVVVKYRKIRSHFYSNYQTIGIFIIGPANEENIGLSDSGLKTFNNRAIDIEYEVKLSVPSLRDCLARFKPLSTDI
jgi:hypothetical protein